MYVLYKPYHTYTAGTTQCTYKVIGQLPLKLVVKQAWRIQTIAKICVQALGKVLRLFLVYFVSLNDAPQPISLSVHTNLGAGPSFCPCFTGSCLWISFNLKKRYYVVQDPEKSAFQTKIGWLPFPGWLKVIWFLGVLEGRWPHKEKEYLKYP